MIQSKKLYELFTALGYGPYISIPCSILKPLINYLIHKAPDQYYAAADEGEALGIAAGMHMAGKKPVVMIQNSGLGNMVDPLTSLNLVFNIPVLLVISWRGEPGEPDEPQHKVMGSLMEKILEVMGIRTEVLSDDYVHAEKQIREITHIMENSNKPAAVIIRKGLFEAYENKSKSRNQQVSLRRIEAIETILHNLNGDEVLIASTGKISRELYFSEKKVQNPFYVLGSMGCAGSIAFGIAQTLPDKKVIVLDGDGALLMRMGTLATIGHYKPENLLHIVLDNESHESTGGQETVSSTVCLGKVAKACGYKDAARVYEKKDLEQKIREYSVHKGPHCILVKLLPGSEPKLGRPKETPEELKIRFIHSL